MQHNHRGEVRKQRKQHCRQRQDRGKVESDGVRKLIEHDVRATLREKKKEKKSRKRTGSGNEQHWAGPGVDEKARGGRDLGLFVRQSLKPVSSGQ